MIEAIQVFEATQYRAAICVCLLCCKGETRVPDGRVFAHLAGDGTWIAPCKASGIWNLRINDIGLEVK